MIEVSMPVSGTSKYSLANEVHRLATDKATGLQASQEHPPAPLSHCRGPRDVCQSNTITGWHKHAHNTLTWKFCVSHPTSAFLSSLLFLFPLLSKVTFLYPIIFFSHWSNHSFPERIFLSCFHSALFHILRQRQGRNHWIDFDFENVLVLRWSSAGPALCWL